MDPRRLGRSGIQVSAMGLGTARLGGKTWRNDDLSADETPGQIEADIGAIHRALDLGITFFDTADVYACGYSERILGQALADRRHEVVIATKFGDTFDDQTCRPTNEEITPAYIRRACEASLRRLKTETIDLYLFHIRDYPLERAGEVRETLEQLVEEGKIRWYGWSTDDLERARFFAEGPHCTAVEHRLNILLDAPEMLALCKQLDLASINRIPLMVGLLGGKWTRQTQMPAGDRRGEYFKHKEFLQDVDRVQTLREVLTLDGRSFVQGALGWIWARSPLAIPVPGFRTRQQAEEDALAMRFGPLRDEQMKEIEQLLGRNIK
jgi:aryl-alcohol dehydrogenase-like predicted oxidoreductase